MMIELLKSQLEVSNATNLQLRLTVERMSSSMKSMEVTISELRATTTKGDFSGTVRRGGSTYQGVRGVALGKTLSIHRLWS